jgi:hypothetical protein
MQLSGKMMASLGEIHAEMFEIKRKLNKSGDKPRPSPCRVSALDAAESMKSFGLPLTAPEQVRFPNDS